MRFPIVVVAPGCTSRVHRYVFGLALSTEEAVVVQLFLFLWIPPVRGWESLGFAYPGHSQGSTSFGLAF